MTSKGQRQIMKSGKAKPSKKLTAYIESVVAEWRPYVTAEPGLTSLLYDIDLLPEQLLHVLRVNPPAVAPNAARMVAVCLLWKARDPAKLVAAIEEAGRDAAL